MAGDPKALELIAGAPGGVQALTKLFPAAAERIAKADPAAFSQLATDSMEQLRQIHPAGFSNYIARIMEADMGNFQYAEGKFTSLPALIERLSDVLPADNAKAQDLLGMVQGYVQRIMQFAQQKVEAPKAEAKASEADPRAAELDTREQKVRRQEWGADASAQLTDIFKSAWDRLCSKLTPAQQAQVKKNYSRYCYNEELEKRKSEFNSKSDKLFSANQRDGFLKTHRSIFSEVVPLALRKAMAEAGIGAKKAPVAAAAVKPGAKPAQPAAGFERVAAKPNMSDVDRDRTSSDMWIKRQAVLRTGKRVAW